jgi:hypothetical protein
MSAAPSLVPLELSCTTERPWPFTTGIPTRQSLQMLWGRVMLTPTGSLSAATLSEVSGVVQGRREGGVEGVQGQGKKSRGRGGGVQGQGEKGKGREGGARGRCPCWEG